MDRLIHDIQALPLWFSIPFGIAYVALIVYFFYVLWRYRQSSLKAYLLIAALLVGQKASADSDITNGGQHYTLFDSEGYYTATAGSNTSGVYTYDYLVDNVIVPSLYGLPYTYTYWLTEDENGFETKFIEFYSANPIVPKGYRLRTACNTEKYDNRRPKSWKLLGKKHADDAQWTELATVTGDTHLPAGKEESHDYWFDTDNTKTYQYFRFEITAIQGSEEIQVSPKYSYTRYRMELSELQIIGNKDNINLDLDYATIEGLQHYYAHTGNVITPSFTVKDMSGNTLTEGTHYTASYSPATVKDVGTYTLTITGKGNYTGQKTASFKVVNTLSGDGTSDNPFIITDAKDWYVFGNYIKEVVNGQNMNTKYYKLADNFDNSNEPITEMIATTKKDPNDGKTIHAPFYGTLDGNGRTLHIDLKADSEDGCAPFRYLEGATIKNLTVAGSVATSSKYGASIAVNNLNHVAYTNGTEIIDCYSSVNITSSINGDGTNGGFVGINHGKLTFTRCAFLGRMLGSTAECNGGFVGWNDVNGDLNFSQCVFGPVWISMSATYSKTFSRYDNNNVPKFSNSEPSYFTYAGWGKNQGTQAVALTTAPANLGSKGETHGKMTLYQNGLECDGKYYVPNLGLYDNASNATLLSQADGKLLDVTLSGRTLFKDGNWNTLCLPFDLSMDQFNDLLDGTSGKLMELDTEGTYDTDKQTGFDPATGTLRLYFKDATEIKAGTPYIIKWPSGTNLTDHKFQNVSIDNSDATLIRQTVESADGRVRFIGTFNPVELTIGDKSNLFLATNSKNKSTLNYPSGGNNGDTDNPKYFVNACRAYFHVDLNGSASVRAYSLHFGDDDGTTGIVDNKRETITNNRWYTLDGRRLNSKPTTKGLYIYNGNKMVVK